MLRQNGVAVFGPSADAARIEGSKTFAKDVLQAAGVPTAETLSVARAPCVVKADGLASGKGVFVCRTAGGGRCGVARGDRVRRRLRDRGAARGRRGVAVRALATGATLVPLGAAQDFKRIGDGDTGPEHGRHGRLLAGAAGSRDADALVERVHQPVIDELARRGAPFVGCLFAGLMLTADGPKVLEFNARFGDPETQVLMPRIEGDLLDVARRSRAGDLVGVAVATGDDAAVTVVLAGPGLPGAQRLRGRADRRARRSARGHGRARLPRRHRRSGRHGGHEWRQNPLRDRDRRHRRGGARAARTRPST